VKQGHFITFEGIEGSGKTTQIERLAEKLRSASQEVVLTREPGGTELGSALRALLLRPSSTAPAPEAELLLYLADRAQHLTQIIEPALATGAIVLCDRYRDATVAYQGYGRQLDAQRIVNWHAEPPLNRMPDRTLWFDIDPEVSLLRARQRDLDRNSAESEGRFEQEALEFHRRVATGYADLARQEPERIRRIDASGTLDEVEARVSDAMRDLLPLESHRC
jgi:dTMP kinase